MKELVRTQMVLGEIDPRFILIDPRNRDELTHVLLGLQAIYTDDESRIAVLECLSKILPTYTRGKTGRPGLSLWECFVLAVVRLTCNLDYDMLKSFADNHRLLRAILGIGWSNEKREFPLQTIRDNLYNLTDEILAELNVLIVKHGHRILGLDGELEARGDSFVVLSNVHYPTDINLLLDAMRKSLFLIGRACSQAGVNGWRKFSFNYEKVRKLYRHTQKLKESKAKDEARRLVKEAAIRAAHGEYIDMCRDLLDRVVASVEELKQVGYVAELDEIRHFVSCGRNLIDQIHRRCLNGETIPHSEKMFSLFEEYTEWISKGKAGVRQELGLNVCIVSDQHGFILHHRVMRREVDADVAVPLIKDTVQHFALNSISFDKGFHSAENQKELGKLVKHVVVPKKGKLSQSRHAEEHEPEFIRRRHAHSAVESTIHGLDSGGLDRCLDRTEKGFYRYVAIGIVARNLKTLGAAIRRSKISDEEAAA